MPSPAPQQLEKVVIASLFAFFFSSCPRSRRADYFFRAGAGAKGPVLERGDGLAAAHRVPPQPRSSTFAVPCFLPLAPNYVASIAVHLISCINVISFHIVKQLRAMIEFHSISLNKHAN